MAVVVAAAAAVAGIETCDAVEHLSVSGSVGQETEDFSQDGEETSETVTDRQIGQD